MPPIQHIHAAGICFFVTTVTARRRKVFERAEYCRLLAEVIYGLRQKRAFLLAGFVIMPDHLHLALFPTEAPLADIMRDVKRGSSRLLNRATGESGRLWQPGYWDRGVDWHDELMQKLSYMAENPVRAGLVTSPEAYPWSTADPGFQTDLDAILGL